MRVWKTNAAKVQESATPVRQHQWNRRILVVDDERSITQAYTDILAAKTADVIPLKTSRRSSITATPAAAKKGSRGEFEVVACHSAEEAFAQVKKSIADQKPFAMGFFDVLLGPGIDGIELVKEIHRVDPNLYSVFVTAYNDRTVDAIKELLGEDRLAFWDYLNKPFSQGEILQKARNFVTLWNALREKDLKDELIAEVHHRLLESERLATVAAVARGVSHEFGNILMQIMGKADIARKKSEADMRLAMEKILDASQRASEILEKFKNLSGPVEHTAFKESVQLVEILDEAVDLLEHQFKAQNVKVCRVKIEPLTVYANATSLIQVVVNLSINAMHAMGTSGQLDFSIAQVGEMAELRVRDYGPGIKVELLDKVMEPFFTTKGDKGTGLGLPICREIIEIEHRGEFQLQNHPVKGLEVIIRLPLGKGVKS